MRFGCVAGGTKKGKQDTQYEKAETLSNYLVKIGDSIEPMGQRWKCHHALGGLARPRVGR